jgi:hypothetical protein
MKNMRQLQVFVVSNGRRGNSEMGGYLLRPRVILSYNFELNFVVL